MRAGFAPRDLPLVVAGVGGLTALAWFDLWRRSVPGVPGPHYLVARARFFKASPDCFWYDKCEY